MEWLASVDGVTCVIAIVIWCLVVVGVLAFVAPAEPPGRKWG